MPLAAWPPRPQMRAALEAEAALLSSPSQADIVAQQARPERRLEREQQPLNLVAGRRPQRLEPGLAIGRQRRNKDSAPCFTAAYNSRLREMMRHRSTDRSPFPPGPPVRSPAMPSTVPSCDLPDSASPKPNRERAFPSPSSSICRAPTAKPQPPSPSAPVFSKAWSLQMARRC